MFPMNSSENGGNGSASESVTDYQSFNAESNRINCDTKIFEDIGLSYLTGINFSETNYDQRGGSYKNFIIDSNGFLAIFCIGLIDKTTFLNRTYSN